MFFALSFLVLAALLYFPASRMMWVLSVRRAERKLARKLDPPRWTASGAGRGSSRSSS